MSQRIFSNEAFIRWIGSQPPTRSYNFENSNECLMCQYFRSFGFKEVRVSRTQVMFQDAMGETQVHQLPEGWDDVASGDYDDYGNQYQRFDGAHQRAQALLAAA